ncbi:MAG: zinc ribbon domain-containing protein [Candidatus Omnitrophica bacterium]|nr:zinc ribbon domain-containing protein [Candidatus Omnitrophota bacterium]
MPIYEYECSECGKINEFLVGVGTGNAELKCNTCGSKELKKVVSQSFVAREGRMIGSQGGRTCCGRTQRCDTPPCAADGTCQR